MVWTQKKEELRRRQDQKQKIDERRMQLKIVEVLTLASERAKMQENIRAMDEKNLGLSKGLEELKKLVNIIINLSEITQSLIIELSG